VKLEVVVPSYGTVGNARQIFEHLRKEAQQISDVTVSFTFVATEIPEEELLEFRAQNPDVKILKAPRGKVYALNIAVENSDADALLFIDSDAKLVRDDVLSAVIRELQQYDFGGGAIDIEGNLWFQRMAQIDYIGLTAAGVVGKEIGETIGVIGAFLFVKREVLEKTGGFPAYICEDAALSAKAEAHGYKQGFIVPRMAVTDAPGHFRGWIKQRIRWATGDAEAALHLVRWSPRKMVLTLLANPAVAIWVLTVLGSIINPLTAMGVLLSIVGAFVWDIFPLGAVALFLGGIRYVYAHILGVLVTGVWARHWARVGGHRKPKIFDIITYYFIYTPLWLAVIIGGIVRALLGTREIAGWVVPSGDKGLKETHQ